MMWPRMEILSNIYWTGATSIVFGVLFSLLYTREYCGNQLNNNSISACPHGCLQRHVLFSVSTIQLPKLLVLHGGNWDGLVHQHPSVADAAFAHIISSQQSLALSTSISTVMMEKRSSQKHWWACVLHHAWRRSRHLFPQHRRRGDFLRARGRRWLASSEGMRNPRLSVDYTRNIKLSFTLTICDRLRKITPQGLRQVHVNVFLASVLPFLRVSRNKR